MIGLSTLTYDADGAIVLRELASSSLAQTKRRVSRTATLDGGATLTDSGFSDSDRTLVINIQNISSVVLINLKRIFELYPLLRITTTEGAFLGALSDMDADKAPLKLTFLVKQKIS